MKPPALPKFNALPPVQRDHAAGCPMCTFYRDGSVKLCPAARLET